MDGHFSRVVSTKDQCAVFTTDLNKDISNQISMFAADIKLFPEIKHWAEEIRPGELKKPCGWAADNSPTDYSVPLSSLLS